MSKHTKEPWIRSYHANGVNFIYSEGRDVHIATCHGGGDETANAKRIVACVNACKGIDTENLEMIGRMFAEKKLASTPLHIIDKVKAENKRLREALEWYAENVGNCNKDGDEGNTARNRLAKDVGSIASAALDGKEN